MAILSTARDFACPACGAKPQEACRLHGGGPRFQSHTDRYDVAQDHQMRMSQENPTAFKKPVRAVMEDTQRRKCFHGSLRCSDYPQLGRSPFLPPFTFGIPSIVQSLGCPHSALRRERAGFQFVSVADFRVLMNRLTIRS
jgi:hypothetical protein